MISMQQLEELESRVIKALQLISDLRAENAKLEADNESIQAQVENAKLSLEEKEQEVARIRKELDDAAGELQVIKEREDVLEKKIIELLTKLDIVQAGPVPISTADKIKESPKLDDVEEPEETEEVDSDLNLSNSAEQSIEDIEVETVEIEEEGDILEDNEDIIVIDEDSDEDVVVESISDKDEEEDDIVLLEEDEDEIVIDDVDEELVIIDESEFESNDTKELSLEDIEDENENSEEEDFKVIENDMK